MAGYPAYILAGGRNSRFGSDKALAVCEGRPLISALAEALAARTSRIVVVADRPGKYEDLGLETIPDKRPGLGPMGGLLTAILDRRDREGDGWLMLAPCDLVRFESGWIQSLENGMSTDPPAIACRTDRWHPLPALYHSSIEEEVQRCVTAGNRSLWRLLDAVGATAVPFPEGRSAWRQANTPEEI